MMQDDDDGVGNNNTEIETDDKGNSAADIPLASNSPVMTSRMKLSDAPSGSMNPVLQQYLQNKQQMADAQKQANNNEMLTGLARAGASLSAGLAKSTAPVDQRPFDAMAATDQQPVTDIQNAQKSQAQDLSNQSAMVADQKALDDQDPNSASSKRFRDTLRANFPKIAAAYGDSFDQLTSADSANVMKVAETKEKIDARKAEMSSKAADRDERASERSDDNQNKAYTDLVNHSEAARGNPAVQQAMTGILNANKALKIADSGQPVTTQQLKLLSDELGKIATGGVPSEHGTEALMPDNLQTRFAKLKEFLTSNPTDADAAKYVKVNSEYLHQMIDVSNDTLRKHYGNLLSGYEDRISDAQKEKYKKNYDLNGNPQTSAPSGGNDHASRAADILARRQASKSAQAPAIPIPNYANPQSGGAQTPSLLVPPSTQGEVAGDGYAYGGTVQPPGFQHIRQPMAPHVSMPKQMAMPMPKAPVAHIPVGMAPTETPQHFELGGTVPGQPRFNHNSPANDTVTAKLTPKEEVLPLSVTQSKSPSMAAYMHMKSRGYK